MLPFLSFHWVRTVLLLVVSTSLSIAAADPKQPQVALTFNAIGWAGNVAASLVYKQNGKWTRLHAPMYAYSETYKYQGAALLELFVAPPPLGPTYVKDDSGEFTAIPNEKPDVIKIAEDALPVVSVALDPSLKRATLLVGESNGKYQIVVIRDNEEEFPPGQVRVLNFSSYRMAIRCNKTEMIALNPKESRIVKAGANEELTLEPAYEINGKWKKLTSKRLAMREGHQASHFFLQSGSNYFRAMDGQIMTALPSFTVYNRVEDKTGMSAVALSQSNASMPARGN